MSTEALVLALTTVVRPTSSAALVAMLSSRRPRRLLAAYLLAGLAFSIAVGMMVVMLLGGLQASRARTMVHPFADLVLGACALGYAACVWVGWLPRRSAGAPEQDGWMRRRVVDLSPSGAAVAGVLTHLPGLVYLAALNAIAATSPDFAKGFLQVGIYNVIWFSLAIAALMVSIYRPGESRVLLERAASWIRPHLRLIVVAFFGALGGYLAVIGVLGLARLSS